MNTEPTRPDAEHPPTNVPPRRAGCAARSLLLWLLAGVAVLALMAGITLPQLEQPAESRPADLSTDGRQTAHPAQVHKPPAEVGLTHFDRLSANRTVAMVQSVVGATKEFHDEQA